MAKLENDGVMTDKQAMSALKQHGPKIVWAIVIALGGYFGWQFYQNNYGKIDTVAADSYVLIGDKNDAINTALASTDEKAIAQAKKDKTALYADIDKLVAEHGKSVYAWQALMIKARHQTDDEQHADAVETLKKAAAIDLQDDGIKAITTLRLARSLLAAGKTEEALSAVNVEMPKAFLPSKEELLGDVFVAQNKTEDAKKSYTTAWNALKERAENRSLLSIKMQALGLTPEPITPKNVVVANQNNAAAQAVTSAPDVAASSSENSSANSGNDKPATKQEDANKKD